MNAIEGTIIDLARQQGAIGAADLAACGFAREYPPRMAAKGLIERIARGRYRLPDSGPHFEMLVA